MFNIDISISWTQWMLYPKPESELSTYQVHPKRRVLHLLETLRISPVPSCERMSISPMV